MPTPTPQDIESLVEIFNRSDWSELHLETDTLEIFLSRDPQARRPTAVTPAAVAVAMPAATTSAPAAPAEQSSAERRVPDGMVAVRAPNLGTFYRAPKPGAPPYVEIGQSVTADTEVCLIEVMKLFTPVTAGIAGTVREVWANDGQMVEFEQILLIVEPPA